ncbi:unnamed protein product [Trichogramma brassicae]|uniref:Uncharacterized protein n=1 Tax=Trichogramma brassicae TaxID=86971 RepID=A0A6H5IXI7_9HYME|nr:unnamed protein product [Trichogramma brassicae]
MKIGSKLFLSCCVVFAQLSKRTSRRLLAKWFTVRRCAYLANQKTSTPASIMDPATLLHRLRAIFHRLQPVPASRHCKPHVFVFQDLRDCDYVFLRDDKISKTLVNTPFTGPWKGLERTEKIFKLSICGKAVTVSIDRLKPAYMLDDNVCATSVENSDLDTTSAVSCASQLSSSINNRTN